MSHRTRVLRVGALSGPDRGQDLMKVPPKQKLRLGEDGLQPYRGIWVPPSKLESIIEGSVHAARSLTVVDFETRLCRPA